MGSVAPYQVLVVDDNKHVLESLGRLLARSGFEPLLFGSFAHAAEWIEQMRSPCAAAMLDVVLDNGRIGLDLARRLRQRFSKPFAIAMISGYRFAEAHVTQVATELGATMLNKPLSLSTCNTFLTEAAIQYLELSSSVERALGQIVTEFSLSPQHARLLAQLASGSTRTTLADDLGLSRDTVKSQVKQLLARTKMSDTNELLAVLLRRISTSTEVRVRRADPRNDT